MSTMYEAGSIRDRMLTGLQFFFCCLRALIELVRVLLAPILIALFVALVLALPDQTIDYYRVMFENAQMAPRTFWAEVVTASVLLVAMVAAIAFAGRVLEIAYGEQPDANPRLRPLLRWAPVVVAVIPLVGLAYGLWLAADVTLNFDRIAFMKEIADFGDDAYARSLDSLFVWQEKFGSLAYVAALALLTAMVLVVVSPLVYRRTDSGKAFYEFTKRPVAILVSAAATAILIALFVYVPVILPKALGPIGVLSLFVICLVILSAQLRIWSLQSELPLIALLAVSAIVFSALDWNDNHQLRRIDKNRDPLPADAWASRGTGSLPTLEDEFLAWYNARKDKRQPAYAKSGYPVYIVAAQGGGIYAAAETLLFLVRTQSACEAFAQHLFAISGVSGGSVGAALYSALASDYPNKNVQCPDFDHTPRLASERMQASYVAANSLVSQDYLSPLLAATLFPDFAQRFLWFPVPAWSRELALEQALEDGWDKVHPAAATDDNPLRHGLAGSWDPLGARPALLLNTTETGSGRRRILAPFVFPTSEANDLKVLPISRDYDVPLSAAAVASARFPWLTPAAWFMDVGGLQEPHRKYRVVDGGYFENSGVATAMDLIDNLKAIALKNKLSIQFNLVTITSGGYAEQQFYGLGEFLAPVLSLLNARRARTYGTIDLADRQLGSIRIPVAEGQPDISINFLQRVEINDYITPLPLGWRLSTASVFQIERQVGQAGHCEPDHRFRQVSRVRAFTSADCVKLLIFHQLRGDDLGVALKAAQERAKQARNLGRDRSRLGDASNQSPQ